MRVVVDSEAVAYNMYRDYGLSMGFSVRKGKNRYVSGTNIIRCKDFYCSKKGFKEFEDDINTKQYNKLETRTGCPAMIRFTVQDNHWTVTHFISEHNHELATPSKRHLLRSARSFPTEKANVISLMVSVGIRPTYVYSYMSNEACGTENVGFTRRDCYNYINKQKTMVIEAGDGQSLLNHFKVRASEDPMFFYTVQVDQENRLTNFFWRDGRSRIDYDCFGDILVFDTTYRTNRYNLICAPFVGINHHRQTIMFGYAFLLDETTASFTWLFKSFL
ncbi:FAR1-related sequence 5 [Hibiscus trionum]|uniref:FAR1-related sequence 5 n=1 Tax=Hibiscus trionum TaxID=183268 RepID=A0A9W7H713_HIBTR|nr:FAR1-related sequence 5 [Hibiscus trionum]